MTGSLFTAGSDKWEIQECEAQGVGQWFQVQSLHGLLWGATFRREIGTSATADGGRRAELVQGVHMVRVQKVCLQNHAGRQQAWAV